MVEERSTLKRYIDQLVNEKQELIKKLREPYFISEPEQFKKIADRIVYLANKHSDEKFKNSVEIILCSVVLKGLEDNQEDMSNSNFNVRKIALEALLILNPQKAITEVYPFLSKINANDVSLRSIIEKYATKTNKYIKI